MQKKIIFFELNEVPFRVLDKYCADHPDGVLARQLPRCRQSATINEDSELDPWVSWPTIHRGVGYARHGIHNFGQHLEDIDEEYPPLWKLLTDRGVKTGVFGSFHTYPVPRDLTNYAFFVPDTFAAGSECFPEQLSTFQDFNLSMARRSGRNVSTEIPREAALKFLAAAPSLGLRPGTLLRSAGQILSERMNRWRRVRRRTYQVVLAFDIFMKQLESKRPAFSTFYTNHVASAMHRYWAASFPLDYKTFGYDAAWVSRFQGEIDFAMGWFERFFARLTSFVDRNPEYVIWISTSMGQAATNGMPMETQLLVTDAARFMRTLGFSDDQWKKMPAMEPDVSLQIAENRAGDFRRIVGSMQIDGAPINVEEQAQGYFNIMLGQANLKSRVNSALVDGRPIPLTELGMSHVEIEDGTGGSAQHVPGGMFLVYEGAGARQPQTRPVISILEIAPAVLRNFELPVPAYMAPGRLAA